MATLMDSVVMTLNSQGEEQIVQSRNEPLILTVSLTNALAITETNRTSVTAHRLRGELDRGALSTSEYESIVKTLGRRRVKRFVLGKRNSAWTRLIRFHRIVRGRAAPLNWRVHVLTNPAPPPIIVLDGYNSALAEFGIDRFPTNLKAGTYVLRASLHAGRGEVVESNDISILLTRRARGNDPETLLRVATYEFRRRRYARAAALVAEVLREFPALIEALILKGDIEAARGRFRKALISYNTALEEFERQMTDAFEQPQSLLAKIDEVEERIGRRGR